MSNSKKKTGNNKKVVVRIKEKNEKKYDKEIEKMDDNKEVEDVVEEKNKYIWMIALIPILVLIILSFTMDSKEEDTGILNYTILMDAENPIYQIENHKFVETEEETELVKIEVKDYGIMIAELYPNIAPITVDNFKKLVSEKFYDNLTFHRVIRNFMIQTGDPTATGSGGSEENIKGEFSLNGVENNLSHTRGVLSMARRGANPDTEETMNSASSQFFIVHADKYPSLDGSYAAFGKVIYGLDVIDDVAKVQTDEYDKPIKDQIITSIRFVYEKKYVPTEEK